MSLDIVRTTEIYRGAYSIDLPAPAQNANKAYGILTEGYLKP
jgi:hypothetical protein